MSDDLTQAKTQVSEQLAEAVKGLKELFERKPRTINKYVGRCNTYYDEKYALQVYPHLVAIRADQKARLFKYENFPALSRNTLYQFLFYARKYLLEHTIHKLIPDEAERNAFIEFASYIGFRRIGLGIVVELTTNLDPIKAEVYDGESEESNNKMIIRKKVDDYLENGAVNTPLKLKDLKLNSEDIEEYNIIFGTYPNLIYNVTRDTISVMKVTEEDYNKLK